MDESDRGSLARSRRGLGSLSRTPARRSTSTGDDFFVVPSPHESVAIARYRLDASVPEPFERSLYVRLAGVTLGASSTSRHRIRASVPTSKLASRELASRVFYFHGMSYAAIRSTFRMAMMSTRPLASRASPQTRVAVVSRARRAYAAAASQPLTNITAQDLKELLEVADEDVVFLDVREKDEWDAGHLPRFELKALSAAGEWLPKAQKEVPANAKVVVMCKLGGRSMRASEALVQMGFTNVCNVVGGYEGYKNNVGA